MKTTTKLSEIARDPVVASFLRRGERDQGKEPAIPAPRKPLLVDGAAAKLEIA